jgi:CheY-like chemotaxis protein
MIDLGPLSNRYFLVVDDEEFQRSMVRRFLIRFGAEGVDEAADGLIAIERLQNCDMSYDAVITDFKMPNLNGIALLKAIRVGALGLKRNTPVIMLTTHSDANLVAMALALDADGFVIKPVSKEGLGQRVERALRKLVSIREVRQYRQVAIPDGENWLDFVPLKNDLVREPLEDLIGPEPSESLGASERKIVNAKVLKEAGKPTKADYAVEQEIILGGGAEVDAREALLRAARTVPLNEVVPGSILAQDLFASDGKTLLLGFETVLSKTLIDRLMDLREVHKSLSLLSVVVPVEAEE